MKTPYLELRAEMVRMYEPAVLDAEANRFEELIAGFRAEPRASAVGTEQREHPMISVYQPLLDKIKAVGAERVAVLKMCDALYKVHPPSACRAIKAAMVKHIRDQAKLAAAAAREVEAARERSKIKPVKKPGDDDDQDS